jgi:signal transduction histidine kinase
MKRLIILFFISLNTFAQTSFIDSLIKETNKTSIHDSVKIKLYGDIAWEFMGSDMNKALEFANKELELATKKKQEANIAQSESDIGSIYNRKSSFDTALIHYNKALSIREKLKQDVKVAGIYTNIATVLMRQSKFEEALAINFKSLKIFEKVGDEVKQAILEAEEKERRRIAQDLHDGVGQLLSAAKLNLSNLDSKITTQTEEQKLAIQNALSLVDDSVKEVRAVSHNMMPNTLIKLGLASAVREFITKLGKAPTLKVDLEIVGLDTRLDNQVETVLYRVIQEIVNNIIKHAKASQISMQLIRHETELNIMIEDNGVGFDTNQLDDFEAIGLKGIKTRIEFLNGSVHFDSYIGRGTTVIIDIPLV